MEELDSKAPHILNSNFKLKFQLSRGDCGYRISHARELFSFPEVVYAIVLCPARPCKGKTPTPGRSVVTATKNPVPPETALASVPTYVQAGGDGISASVPELRTQWFHRPFGNKALVAPLNSGGPWWWSWNKRVARTSVPD
ncbi:unnamed protein product [Calypogeia fissa]